MNLCRKKIAVFSRTTGPLLTALVSIICALGCGSVDEEPQGSILPVDRTPNASSGSSGSIGRDCELLLVESRLCNWPSVDELVSSSSANSNCVNLNGESGLMLAAYSKCEEAVQILLDAGADAGAKAHQGENALFYAALSGSESIVRKLLAAKVKPDIKTEDRWTPLMAAAAGGHTGIVSALVEAGAFSTMTALNGETPLSLASHCVDPGWDVTSDYSAPPVRRSMTVSEAAEVSFVGARPGAGCFPEVAEVLRGK